MTNKFAEEQFKPWKDAILKAIQSQLSTTNSKKFPNPILENNEVKEYLKSLHSKFVLVPTDKASNNVSIVCKKFYVDCLNEELGNTDSYEEVKKLPDEIINEHCDLLGSDYSIDDSEMKLPYIYWLPKQHKSPPKSRFVISGKFCTVKSLSKSISKALKIVQKTLGFRNKYDFKFVKSSSFWIIDNANRVHSDIRDINRYHQAKSISTFDFSTLYTMIPHSKLLTQIRSVIEMAFNITNKKYIRVNRTNATWAVKLPAKSKLLYYDIDGLMQGISFLLENLFIKYNGKVYRQIVGIPIGSDCSQDLANLFLFSYEHDYVRGLVDEGNDDAEFLQHSSRYIDDLLLLNDMGYMERLYSNIYPSELVLNKTNDSPMTANYLDLKISIVNNTIKTELYDKRDEFDFKVISLPHMKSNTPQHSCYGVFASQVYRLFKANSEITGFYSNVGQLIFKLCKQGFTYGTMVYHLNKFIDKHFLEITFKYWEVIDMCKFSKVN